MTDLKVVNAGEVNENTTSQSGDGVSHDGSSWFYTDVVKDHFLVQEISLRQLKKRKNMKKLQMELDW